MDLTAWMVDSVTVAAPSGVSNYGDLSFGSQSTVAARVQQTTEMIRDASGSELQATHIVYTESAIALESRVWLSGADTGDADAARVVRATNQTHDRPGGQTLYKAWLA